MHETYYVQSSVRILKDTSKKDEGVEEAASTQSYSQHGASYGTLVDDLGSSSFFLICRQTPEISCINCS
jgi:hypothetical protein